MMLLTPLSIFRKARIKERGQHENNWPAATRECQRPLFRFPLWGQPGACGVPPTPRHAALTRRSVVVPPFASRQDLFRDLVYAQIGIDPDPYTEALRRRFAKIATTRTPEPDRPSR